MSRIAEVRRRRGLWFGATALYAAGIWWLSSRRVLGEEPGFPLCWLANFFHFPLFGGLAWTLAQASVRSPEEKRGVRAAGVVLLVVLYGALDEWHQSQVPGRSADPFDVVTDGLGAAAFVLLWRARGSGRGLRRAALGVAVISLLALAGTAWNSL